jgi:hypothetical protein
MGIKEMGLKVADWINLDEDRDQGWIVVNMVINEFDIQRTVHYDIFL